MDPPLKSWIASKPDVVAIEFHTSFPYVGDPFYQANVSEQDAWRDEHNIISVPSIRFDGPHHSATNTTAYENAYQARKAIPSRATVELGVNYNAASQTGEVTATVTAEEMLAGSWRLVVAVTESDIHYQAPNGIDVHEHVFRKFLPGPAGTALTFAGPYPDEEVQVLPFTIDPSWAEENIQFVAILQETGTLDVEQADAAELQGGTGVDPGPAPVPTRTRLLRVTPNPFNPNAQLTFTLAEAGRYTLRVYDQGGQLVRTLTERAFAPGQHRLRWNGRNAAGHQAASGTYFVVLRGPGVSEAQKAVLLR